MKKLIIALVLSAAAVTALWFVAVPLGIGQLGSDRSGGSVRVLERARWEPFGYQLAEGPKARSYNLPITITVPPDGQPSVRVLVDLQDRSNYYFVELTPSRSRIGKVESGLEADLGVQTPAGLVAGTNRVVLKRRYDSIEAVLNDAVVARAEDESFHGGSIGAGEAGGGASLKIGKPQPCDPVHFWDDFMTPTGRGGWEEPSGKWEVATLRNPSLSSNAFYYVGIAPGGKPPATAVRGEWFWDNYRFRAAAMSSGKTDMGIYFYYRDENNYYLFRWNAEGQPQGGRPRKQLVKRSHGQEALLAEAPGGYQPEVWYEMEAEVIGDRIRAFIDGNQVFSVTDPGLCFGRVGLYSAVAPPGDARFDDILVRSVRGFEDDFSTLAAGRWRPLGGTWEQRTEGGRTTCFVSADAPAKAIAGSSEWRNYAFSADIRLPQQMAQATEVGVVSHYLDETNYALFAWQPAAGAVRLEAMAEGKSVAQEHAIVHKAPPGTKHLMGVEWKEGVAIASLDGQPVASVWAPGLPRGAVGLHAAQVERAAIERVRVAFSLPPKPLMTTHKIFSHELTMEVWSGAANDWEPANETLDGASAQLYWHRAALQGDATMQIEVKEAELKGAAAGSVARGSVARSCRMVLSAESGKGALSGYNFVLAWPTDPKGAAVYEAAITRHEAVEAKRKLTLKAPVRRLRFERLGSFVIASVNDEPILAAKDPHPLPGSRAGFAALNFPVPTGRAATSADSVSVLTFDREDVGIYSDNVRVSSFSEAVSDWRPAAGTWEISNRWECDPRWSFFSSVPESGSELAGIWNKYAYEGDVTVEFAVGPKMETARGGTAYGYTRDFNVTICGDGRDLNSGYSFMFGGWKNKETVIARGNTVVARSSNVIPVGSGIHRRWFYVKAEKVGPTLTLYVDGTRVLTYTDPTPLPGNRVGIWTWANGIMVARVRIGASAIRGAEPPGTPRGPCRTIYNQ